MSNINKIRLSGQTYNIEDENASKTVELTQAQYDALSTKDPNTFYVITDAQGADLSNYYTKSETSGATEISTALASKADTATTYTKTEVDTALASKQTTLTAGTNITIVDNVISATGGGGGGKAVSGGTNISITTGETADTINCTLPITATTGSSNIELAIGENATAQASYNSVHDGGIAIGYNTYAKQRDIAIGGSARNRGNWNDNILIGFQTSGYSESVCIGSFSKGYNGYEARTVSLGYLAQAANMKNAVAIGANVSTTGTTKTNINNQLTIDTSNQVYIYNKDNTEMICLQDQLGGGASYTAGDGIDITNDVISVTGKVDTSAITTSISSSSTDTQIPSAKAVYDTIGNINTILESI